MKFKKLGGLLVVFICVIAVFFISQSATNPCEISSYDITDIQDKLGQSIYDAGGVGVYKISESEFLLIDNSDLGTYINRKIKAYTKNNSLHITYTKEWAINDENLESSTQGFVVSIPSGVSINKISLKLDSVI